MGMFLGKNDGIPRKDPVDTTILKQSNNPIIFVIGGPATGKFILGRRLAARYGLQLVSPADMLRSEVDAGSERGRRFERIMKEGRHVPADVIVQLVEEKMMTQPDAAGYLIIGFPRNRSQVVFPTVFPKCLKRARARDRRYLDHPSSVNCTGVYAFI